jgi:hypothetical protein
MKLTVTKAGRKKEYDIDFFHYQKGNPIIHYKVIGVSGIKNMVPQDFDKIELEKD